MEINKKKFGKMVKEYRKENSITQLELAQQLQISQGSLCDVENGLSLPSATTILAFHMMTNLDILQSLYEAKRK